MLLARNLFEDIRAERLTPRDVLELCAVAIAEQEADVHAFAALDLDRARTAAEAPGLARTPLAGLPVGIKDVIDTADLPTAYGTEAFAGNQPRTDAAVVRQVKRAGGSFPARR